MALTSLNLINFRSYSDRVFDIGSNVTLVVGPNASGKTNLLESLYVLASTKSFRTRDYGMVRHTQDHFRVVGRFNDQEVALGYQLLAGHQTKQVSRNGVKQSLVSHIGTIQVTLFEPSDLELVSGAPERRRKYLDYILCQTDQEYLKILNQYKRVLKQRNSLLSAFDTSRIKNEIFAWDVKLTELATEIYSRRMRLIEFLNELIPPLYGDVAGETVGISLGYAASVEASDYAGNFMDELTRRLTMDLAAGFTTFGPHREDFKISFKNNDIVDIASRGETRTVVLVMKLAELAYSETQSGVKPILLLDDVFSELDSSRRGYLVQKVRDHQTIITTTEADSVQGIGRDYELIKTEASHVGR